MKKALLAVLLMVGARAVFAQSATEIQGQTPSGGLQAVGVTENGYLNVNFVGSTTTLQSVDIASPIPLPVAIDASSNVVIVGNVTPVPVTFSGPSVSSSVPVATTVTVIGNGTNIGNGWTILPASATRYQSTICNNEDIFGTSTLIYLGDSTVTPSNFGAVLRPGQCYSPDNPAVFQGTQYAASTATVHWSYIAH